jgi:WD40 repeat protein
MSPRDGWPAWLAVLALALLIGGVTPPPAAPAAAPARPRTDLYGDPLPRRAVARLGSLRLRHADSLTALAFSPDGKVLAAATGSERWVTLWQMPSGRPLRRLPIPGEGGERLLFSPDGRWLASVARERASSQFLQIWEVASGKQTLRGEVGRVLVLAFAPAGKALATGDESGSVEVWSPDTGKRLRRHRRLPGMVGALVFPAPDKLLAVAWQGTQVSTWDLTGGRKLSSFRGPGKAHNTAAAFSPHGRTLALGGDNGIISLRDPATGKEHKQLRGHTEGIYSLTFSPGGRTLASGGRDDMVRLWDLPSGKQRAVLSDSPAGLPFAVFSPDGKTVATGGGNGQHRVRLWDAATGKEREPFPGHGSPVTSAAFSPDGRLVATAAWDRRDRMVYFWDHQTGRLLRRLRAHDDGVRALAFSADGKLLATAGWMQDPDVRLWDLATGAPRGRLKRVGDVRLAFSPDGKWLAADARDICLWKLHTRKEALHLPGPKDPNDPTPALAFTDAGRTLVRSGNGLSLFDIPSGRPRPWGTWVGGFPVALSPDGRILATAHRVGPTRLWEMASGGEILRLPPGYFQVVFSPGCRFVAAAKQPGPIRVFDLATGAECLKLPAREYVQALAFSPDGKRLVSGGSEDSTALVWDVSDLPALAPRLIDREPDAAALRRWWADLMRADAGAAHRAAWRLAAAGPPAVRLLQGELRAAKGDDAVRVARLVRQLEDDDFAVREKATHELARLGPDAEEALRAALTGEPSLEARRRIQRLLDRKVKPTTATEQLRARRALAVLERIGTPEARDLLRKLAGGAPGARLTQEAKDALKRLEKTPARR